jgi:ATP adenylyltransferase
VAEGAILPIETQCEIVRDGGIPFAVRILSSLARKAEARYQEQKASGEPQPNPFLPYDERLHVADLRPDHVCLLNKYNVVDDHVLVVTRQFEVQESTITREDFDATCDCLWELGGLAFYNSSEVAGASQPHKHLQVVAGCVCPGGSGLPIDDLLPSQPDPSSWRAPALPYAHAFRRLAGDGTASGAEAVHSAYQQMLDLLNLRRPRGLTADYNLLFTREWVLVVPRVCECFDSISINALGFAGALLVRDDRELQLVKSRGPVAVLQHTTPAE